MHTDVEVGLLAAEREPAMLFELTRNRLERVSIPKPVVACACWRASCRRSCRPRATCSTPRAQQALPWPQLRERLRARLGDEAVYRVAPGGRSAPGTRLAPRRRPRRRIGAPALPAAPGLAAAAARAAARPRPAHRLRPRAPGKRLVGWRGRAPRLLRAGNLAGPARLGVRAGRASGTAGCCTGGSHERRRHRMAWTAIRRAAACRAPWKWPAACASRPTTTTRRPIDLPAYAELHCLSDFSFLRGASSAEELFARARRCGYEALAITDECSLAGIVRALEASRATGLKLIVGSEFSLDDGLRLVLLVETLAGYTQLCQLITTARRAAGKGRLPAHPRRCRSACSATTPHRGCSRCGCRPTPPDATKARWLRAVFGARALPGGGTAPRTRRRRPPARLLALAQRPAAAAAGHRRRAHGRAPPARAAGHDDRDPPWPAAGRVRRAPVPQRRAPPAHAPRAGQHLSALRCWQASVALARRCTFTMDQIQYRYPAELVPEGHTPASHLRALTEAGMRERWPDGVAAAVSSRRSTRSSP